MTYTNFVRVCHMPVIAPWWRLAWWLRNYFHFHLTGSSWIVTSCLLTYTNEVHSILYTTSIFTRITVHMRPGRRPARTCSSLRKASKVRATSTNVEFHNDKKRFCGMVCGLFAKLPKHCCISIIDSSLATILLYIYYSYMASREKRLKLNKTLSGCVLCPPWYTIKIARDLYFWSLIMHVIQIPYLSAESLGHLSFSVAGLFDTQNLFCMLPLSNFVSV